MKFKSLMITGSALFALSFSGVASASYHKINFKQFRECLRTEPLTFDGTIVQAAQASPDTFSKLVDLVVAAGLVETLSGDGPFTVLAPTNDAFGNVPADVLNAIGADPTGLLTADLTYHVIPGQGRRLDPRRVFFPYEFKTVFGQTVFFNRSTTGPQVNQSNVDCRAVKTSNGTIWVIDSVLLPQF